MTWWMWTIAGLAAYAGVLTFAVALCRAAAQGNEGTDGGWEFTDEDRALLDDGGYHGIGWFHVHGGDQ